MEIKDGYFYFLSKDYLKKHKDKHLMSTWKENGTARPFYCVSDPERPSIKWMIPITSEVKKKENIKNNKRANNKSDNLIVINRIKGFSTPTVFLIQNACPCLETDIVSQWKQKNGTPISMVKGFNKKMQKTMRFYSHLISAGIQIGFISREIFKDVAKEYINTSLITSKEFAMICKDAIKKQDASIIKSCIVKHTNGKRYEVLRAELNYNNDNINILAKRDEKFFVDNILTKDKLDCDFEKTEPRDLVNETMVELEKEELKLTTEAAKDNIDLKVDDTSNTNNTVSDLEME